MENRNVRSPRRPAPRQQSRRRNEKPPRSESRWFRAILMVIATLALCVFVAVFLLRSASDLFGLNQEDRQIEVEIPEDAGLTQVATILHQSGAVDQQLTFQIYASLQKDEKYYGGKYIFNSNMGYDEILSRLRTGSSQKEVVTLYFTEGRNAYEIAQLLEEYEVCNAQEFLDYLQSGDFDYEFIDRMPTDSLRFRRFEGYIFPDTYEFYVGESVDQVAKKFLSNFADKISTQMETRMRDLNLTLDEAIILASIIQKDAGSGGLEQMKMVSSVYHNRIDLKEQYPLLQSDVTKYYVNSFIVPFHDVRNQNMYDAYNTYVREGLPVGPICNPGADAIEAALYPEESANYFFVVDVQDGFYYAENEQDHYSNIRIAARVEGDGKIHGVDTE